MHNVAGVLPWVQVFPSNCRLMPVGQAQLEALGVGARRHRWLQPPLFTAHGLCTTMETHHFIHIYYTLDTLILPFSGRGGKLAASQPASQTHSQSGRQRRHSNALRFIGKRYISLRSVSLKAWYEPQVPSALWASDLGSVYLAPNPLSGRRRQRIRGWEDSFYGHKRLHRANNPYTHILSHTHLSRGVGGTCVCPWGSPGFRPVCVVPGRWVCQHSGCSWTASLSSTACLHTGSGQRGAATGCLSTPRHKEKAKKNQMLRPMYEPLQWMYLYICGCTYIYTPTLCAIVECYN